jgi:hypothetical protein
MQIKRFVASSLAALMAGATFAGAALAATSVGGILKTLGSQAAAGTPYLVVVGDTAAASDVVGAIDVASAVAQQVTKEVSVPGVTVTQVDGLEKQISLGSTDTVSITNPTDGLPSTLKTFHYSGLKQGTFLFAGENYDYYEEVGLDPAIVISHSLDDTQINGTQKIKIPSAQPVEYRFIFNKNLNKLPSYDDILTVNVLGKELSIVGLDASGIKVLAGNVGVADSSTPVAYKNYKVYVTDGASGTGAWASIQIKDESGNILYSDILNQGDVKSYSLGGETVKVKLINVWASTVTNTVRAKLAVGSEVEKTYPPTLTTDPSYTFPGTTDWYMYFSDTGTTGNITVGDAIKVVYSPSEDKYLSFGDKFVAPNGYFELSMTGWNTNNFAKITITPVTGRTLYGSSAATTPLYNYQLSGFEISSDVKGTIKVGADNYDKIYILFSKVNTTATNPEVHLAYWDSANSKIVLKESLDVPDDATSVTFTPSNNIVLTYSGFGEVSYKLTVTFKDTTTGSGVTPQIDSFAITDSLGNPVTAVYPQYSLVGWTTTSVPTSIKLGNNANSVEADDIKLYTDASQRSVGDKSQDIVTNTPIILVSPSTYTASDKVVFKIPATTLKAKVAFGKIGGVVSEGGTYKTYAPLSLPVAKLASEVTPADKANAHIVLVGGPCANSLVQALVDAGKLDASMTCAGGNPGPAWTPGAAYVKVVEDAFATGKVALVVAGTNAADTRLATSLLSQGKLVDQTASGVKVSGTVTAPVVTPM